MRMVGLILTKAIIQKTSGRGRTKLKPSEWQEVSQHVEKMLQNVNFGSITLVIQDGKVVQIEKSEKVRLQSNKTR